MGMPCIDERLPTKLNVVLADGNRHVGERLRRCGGYGLAALGLDRLGRKTVMIAGTIGGMAVAWF